MQTKTSAPYSPLVKMSYRASPPPTLHTPSGQRTTPQGPQSPPLSPSTLGPYCTHIFPLSLGHSSVQPPYLLLSAFPMCTPFHPGPSHATLHSSLSLMSCTHASPLPHPNDRLWHFSPTPSPPPPPFENLPYPIISFPVFDMFNASYILKYSRRCYYSWSISDNHFSIQVPSWKYWFSDLCPTAPVSKVFPDKKFGLWKREGMENLSNNEEDDENVNKDGKV